MTTIYDISATTARERGAMYGELARETIHAFLDDGLAQINRLRQPMTRDKALALSTRYLDCLRGCLPDLADEVAGLADGAGISAAEAMLLQVRRELIGWDEDCTSIAFVDPARGAVIAQSIDLAGNLGRHVCAVRYRHATRLGGAITMWAYSGLLGYLGVNSHGIAVGINMTLAGGWRIGVPPYLLVRHLLTLDTLDACMDAIARIPRASSRSLILGQDERLINVEMTVTEHRTIEGPLLTHSNHYLHPDFERHDLMADKIGSIGRNRHIGELARELPSLTAESVKHILKDHTQLPGAICAHSDDFQRGRTVSAAILVPREHTAELCFGHPCTHPFSILAPLASS